MCALDELTFNALVVLTFQMLMNATDSLSVLSCVLTPLVPINAVVDQALSWVQMAIHVQVNT